MAISHKDSNDYCRYIYLSGRLDIQGTEEIEVKLAELTLLPNRIVVVDCTEVTFLASIGIRALISNAKKLKKMGANMMLLINNNSSVQKTLEIVGIDTLVPLFTNQGDLEMSISTLYHVASSNIANSGK